MAGSMLFLRSLFIVLPSIFGELRKKSPGRMLTVPAEVDSSSAQIVTGTLLGVAYPTAIVKPTLGGGAYEVSGPVPWIVNDPQISILGIDTTIDQTTFAYQDVYTEISGSDTATVTESGILVQNTAGMYFTEPPSAARIPVVQSCAFNKAGAAVCEINNNAQGTSTITGTRTPLFTFTAALPTAVKALTGSKAASKTGSSPASAPTRARQAKKASSQKVPVGAIVGAAIGGVVLGGGALAVFLLYRRRRQRNNTREKNELDPEPARAFMPLDGEASSSSDSRLQGHASSFVDTAAGTNGAPTVVAFTNAPEQPETQRQRRRRLKQMQVTVQQLQRNLSVPSPGDGDAESQIAGQQQQIDMLLEEVERLRAIVAREESLPVYEE
ncbi:hypothetical protein C8R45DRAFT_987357 [Mycena sanguinolenta]|nr:hypothetical protein C8R45DRAFT_987357 [Mycena sanguinolenta]